MSAPEADLEPSVVAALAEAGIDLSGEFLKPLTDDVMRVVAADADESLHLPPTWN